MVARRIVRKRKKKSIVGSAYSGSMLIYRFRREVIQKDQPDVTVDP